MMSREEILESVKIGVANATKEDVEALIAILEAELREREIKQDDEDEGPKGNF